MKLSLKLRKVIKIFALVVLPFCIWTFLFWYAVAPIIQYFIPCVTYHDMAYYTKGTYTDFEDGDDFRTMLKMHGVAEKGEVVDFWYLDRKWQDNPIHGKVGDYYIIDLQVQPDVFEAELNDVSSIAVAYQSVDDFVTYALPYDKEAFPWVQSICFCRETNTIRYIMMTERESTDSYWFIFFRLPVAWEIAQANT